MKFIDNIYTNTNEVKQSKFIAYLTPYTQYKSLLEKLKNQHLKARHFVVAYRYLNEFNQIVEYSSDDGEPKGTSGKPSLMVLQGSDIINCAVIVVRYFGGTKLGTGGLVRAYSDSVNNVVTSAKLSDYKEQIEIKISFEYSKIRQIEYACEILNIDILDKVFNIETTYKLKSDKLNIDKFLQQVGRLIKQREL